MNSLMFLLNSSSWDSFKQSLSNFFEHGLGGPGAQGIGIAIAAIGIVMSVVSFIVHKYNQQTRMPGPVINLLIGLAGAILTAGIGKPLALLEQARDTLFSWFGL